MPYEFVFLNQLTLPVFTNRPRKDKGEAVQALSWAAKQLTVISVIN